MATTLFDERRSRLEIHKSPDDEERWLAEDRVKLSNRRSVEARVFVWDETVGQWRLDI